MKMKKQFQFALIYYKMLKFQMLNTIITIILNLTINSLILVINALLKGKK